MLRTYIQVMHLKMFLARILKCLSFLNAKITLMDISDCSQTVNYRRQCRIILNNHVNINARLGRHSFDSGAANVFNADDKTANYFFNFTLYFFKS